MGRGDQADLDKIAISSIQMILNLEEVKKPVTKPVNTPVKKPSSKKANQNVVKEVADELLNKVAKEVVTRRCRKFSSISWSRGWLHSSCRNR